MTLLQRQSPPPARFAAALLAASLLAAGLPASAAETGDTARIQELERKLERSMQMIEALAKKLQQLEQASAAAPTGDARQNARIDELQQDVAELTAARSHRGAADDGLPLHGFADVGVGHSGEDNIDRNGNRRLGAKGFTVGTLDLYLTPQFGDRVKSLVELAFEVEEDGGVIADLERLQVGYSFGDSATAWLGRFHTPFGYWNTAFHHGMQFQTSIQRPRFLDFEDKGGILPAHTTGAWLNGKLPLAGARLGYDLYLGNAPSLRIEAGNLAGTLDMKMSGSAAHASSAGFNLSLRPDRAPDLLLGVHGLRIARVRDSQVGNETRVAVLGGYGVYHDDRWEAMAEFYRFRNTDLGAVGGAHGSSAWYAQLGYTVGALTPFARFERTRLDQNDNYFLQQEHGRSYARAAVGTRYDLNAKAALKLELNRTRQDDTGGPGLSLRDSYSEARLQYAIRF